MRLKLLCVVTVIAFFSGWLTGCGKEQKEDEVIEEQVTPGDEDEDEEGGEDGEETPEQVLSIDEQQQIITVCNEITEAVNTALSEGATETDFDKLLEDLQAHPMVEKAWIEGQTLMVKFLKGGIISWQIQSGDIIIPPYQDDISVKNGLTASASDAFNMPGNNKVCLINQQFNDEGRGYCRDVIEYLNSQLVMNEYEVTVKNGAEADVAFFREELSRYGIIFCISHGSYSSANDIAWILTGEETDSISRLFTDLYTWWTESKISVGYVWELRNGEWTSVASYTISNRLIESEYAPNSFPNSLIYWVACQSMKTSVLGKALHDRGAGVTVGWDETNCLGQSTGVLLFQSLLGGVDISSAFLALPEEARKDDCAVADGANLVYYPEEGGTMRLVATATPTSVILDSPVSDSLYVDRVLQLSGCGLGFKTISKGTVEVNGIATNLTLTGDTTFSQPVEINEGDNLIKVNCYGVQENGKSAFASTELTVTGDFPVLALYTQLRWNTNYTDVDFHLLPPNSTVSDLWTQKDCYFGWLNPTWGAYLDVDDVDGYGPEHITIPAAPAPGIYTLYVHYYSCGGGSLASDVFVNVAANNGSIVNLGPYRLNRGGEWQCEGEGEDQRCWLTNRGDVWEICTIEYPAGKITPVNKYHNLNTRTGIRSSAGMMIKKK
jgi:hypothetical protein